MKLDEFELLCDRPIFIDSVGYIKKPQLYDIREIGYETYKLICSYLSVDLNKYLEITDLKEKYEKLSEEGKIKNSFFNLLMNNEEFRKVYKLIFSFFISDKNYYNSEYERFEFFAINIDEKSKEYHDITGKIDSNNFEDVRSCILQICNIKQETSNVEEVKYKNETARKWAEKMENAEKNRKNKDELSIGKMISKYCAANKNGINILNVYSLTFYQFIDQFAQHNYIRQSDVQDMIYANTVSFSDVKDYDSQAWLK